MNDTHQEANCENFTFYSSEWFLYRYFNINRLVLCSLWLINGIELHVYSQIISQSDSGHLM